jgi:hypothetical protein
MGNGRGIGTEADLCWQGGGVVKDLDFLPASFHMAAQRRQMNRRNTVLSICVAMGLLGLHWVNESRLRTAQAALQNLQSDSILRENQAARLEVLTVRKHVLCQRQSMIDQLDDDAPLDIVLAEITRMLSKQMQVHSLILAVQPVVPESKHTVDPIVTRGPTQITMRGEAQSDVQVGILVGKLSACQLFEDVRLKFSRAADSGSVLGREFELTFGLKRIALNRQGLQG